MKRQRLILACVLTSVLAVQPASFAVTALNPYVDAITNRNLFNLKAPPTADELASKVPPPAIPSVTFVGITTLMGGKRAMLRVPRPARAPEPAKEIPLILCEGAPAEEGVQVLEIDIATASVKIINNGTPQTLDLAKNAPKSAAAPPPGAVLPIPGANPRSAIPMPVPAAAPAAAPGSVASIGRPLRGTSPTATTTPSSILGAGPSGLPSSTAQAAASSAMSAEEQMVIMEVERERIRDKVAAGRMPPLPPTPLTPPGSTGVPATPPVPGL